MTIFLKMLWVIILILHSVMTFDIEDSKSQNPAFHPGSSPRLYLNIEFKTINFKLQTSIFKLF